MKMIDSRGGTFRRLLVAGGLGLAVACAASSANASWFSNLFNGGQSNTADAPDPSIFAKTTYCPPVQIRIGTEALSIYERGHDGDPNFVRFEASLSKTARECHTDGSTMSIKVGIIGRLLAGPKGNAGSFTVPIRIAVVKQHGMNVLFSAVQKAPVSLEAPSFSADFTYVFDNITFPIAPDDHDLIVYVGYDAGKPKKPAPTG